MQGKIEKIKGEFNIDIPLEIMKEGERVIIYTHALDLCGYGSTADEAKKDFDNAVQIFFHETIEHGTLDKALEELGWKKVSFKNRNYWQPQTEVIGSSLEKIKISA